jgi:hypothetical protein
VTLSADRDRFGMRRAKVLHNFGTENAGLVEALRRRRARRDARGGGEGQLERADGVGHLNGGTIMGVDPAVSVTDPYGRVHGIPNLVIAGSGLFPSTGAASPTFSLDGGRDAVRRAYDRRLGRLSGVGGVVRPADPAREPDLALPPAQLHRPLGAEVDDLRNTL